ncbi:molybdopterin-synthase adenylyltransferase MoeB [Galbibacter mesophilus]|uniref:molybdopterin-synthase adenylyltransferase MoeB n=1 Tax=Galbibacter mesophilus TaxID=379069 RepID=UPI00191ED835|nr:HesA/MoeB/ThiF family protein [Galbibacter mesophilus]MCM5661988.1 HesA/MoeB/ThiF family protein [Galbibacter mesophilus]
MNDKRYIRQTILKSFGRTAQEKLKHAKVLVVGAGGLGVPVLQYLNAMGVGTLGIVENDTVDISNLQRQVMYAEGDVGKSKLDVISEKLQAQNSETELHRHPTFLHSENALEIIKNYDVVVDATDNFPARYLINDACVLLKKPFVYGALHEFEGQVSVFNYKNGPTYRCLFPNMPNADEMPNCNENGVLGVVPGIIGNLQALEAVKMITGIGKPLAGKLLIFDGLQQQYQQISFDLQSENLAISELQSTYENVSCATDFTISVDEFSTYLNKKSPLQIIDVRTPQEYETFHFENSINIPLQELSERINEIDAAQNVYLVCQSGVRSKKAVDILKEKINSSIFELEGGINNYNRYAINH